MVARSWVRGHPIFMDKNFNWKFYGTGALVPVSACEPLEDAEIECVRCGKLPDENGHDACLGHIDGAISACCGHGAHEGYVKYQPGHPRNEVDDGSA